MKKITKKQLKAWGKAYQKGRPMPLRAQVEQMSYLIEHANELLETWEEHSKKYMSFGGFLRLQKGMWEIQYGFYREWKL